MIGYISAIYERADLANAGEEIQGWLGLLQTGGEDEVTGKDNGGWPCSYIISKTDPEPTVHFDNFGSRSWSSSKICYSCMLPVQKKIIKFLNFINFSQYSQWLAFNNMITSFSFIHLDKKIKTRSVAPDPWFIWIQIKKNYAIQNWPEGRRNSTLKNILLL